MFRCDVHGPVEKGVGDHDVDVSMVVGQESLEGLSEKLLWVSGGSPISGKGTTKIEIGAGKKGC